MIFADEADDRKTIFVKALKKRRTMALVCPILDRLEAFVDGGASPDDAIAAIRRGAREAERIDSDFRKRPDVILAGIAMDENRHITEIGDTAVSVRLGDVTAVFADAILSPTGPDGRMRSGAADAIREAGGDGIEAEAVSKAPLAGAVATGPGSLPHVNVIHAPAAGEPGGPASPERVERAVAAALALAAELSLESVAIPGVGTVDGGLSPEASAGAIVRALAAHQAAAPASVILVAADEETADAFAAALEAHDAANN
ncbi:MAG: macro domain-containing protein [Candidatus Krumholzibacteriota bacterium]|nr:macro domain-containing protein [Candidatus Krumholzibacteriota bacterium]